MTKKYNFTGRFYYDLIRICGGLTFLGHPVMAYIPEMRFQQFVDGMRRRQLSHHRNDERLDDKMRLEQVRNGKLQLEVGTANPQLRHDPVFRLISRRPDWIVRCRNLLELDGDGDEVAAWVAHHEQHQRRRDVTLVGVSVDCRNVAQETVVGYVQLTVLQDQTSEQNLSKVFHTQRGPQDGTGL